MRVMVYDWPYIPQSPPCPSCGHCPTCGRGGHFSPYPYPMRPYFAWWGVVPPVDTAGTPTGFTWTTDTTTSTTLTS